MNAKGSDVLGNPHMARKQVLAWGADAIDEGALDQAAASARLPFLAGHLALMPDAHWGMGATVGSVIPTRGAIVPAAVGVDIGCGMIAVATMLTAEDLPDDLSWLLAEIGQRVPAGVGRGHVESDADIGALVGGNQSVAEGGLMPKAQEQMGTLGSGNHFVEICLDEIERVWVVLHSGSRGVGNILARKHIGAAKSIMAEYFIALPDPDLAYLVQGSNAFEAYIRDLVWAQDSALANRETMMDTVLAALHRAVYREEGKLKEAQRINCHHNYTAQEIHGGENIWVTRKGAIRARVGDLGVIPGSMGTDSFIVEGLGNEASYNSAPHGAGRKMARGKARRTLDVGTFRDSMAGISWQGKQADVLLDEDPRSYKDIHGVMRASADLVRPVHHLRQVLNYKGT